MYKETDKCLCLCVQEIKVQFSVQCGMVEEGRLESPWIQHYRQEAIHESMLANSPGPNCTQRRANFCQGVPCAFWLDGKGPVFAKPRWES